MLKRIFSKKEKGFSLIEVVIAMLILGIVAAALLSGLATASRAIYIADERATAESLARDQMESVKKQAYLVGGAYDIIDPTSPEYGYPATYSITLTANPLAGALGGIQEITVTVSHHGDPKFTLVDYKVNR